MDAILLVATSAGAVGVDWPGADLAIPGLILLFAATALILVRLARPAAVGAAR